MARRGLEELKCCGHLDMWHGEPQGRCYFMLEDGMQCPCSKVIGTYPWIVEDRPTPEGNWSILSGRGTQVAVAVTKEIAELIVKLARNAPDGKCVDYCDACGEGVSHC